MDKETLARIKQKVHSLPMQPGVYYMKDKSGKIIYVGKAKLLKNRVSSYFTAIDKHLPKVAKMVSLVYDFDYIITSTEVEALILECSEIKRHKPQYNILLKDDKNYPYIKIDIKSEYPRVRLSRVRESDGAKYFGPYTGSAKEIIKLVNKLFKLPDCGRIFPRDINKGRPCLNYSINNCSGVCAAAISKEEYRQAIDSAILFLEGKYDNIIKELEEKMLQFAESEQYEKAAVIRDQLFALKKLFSNQQVVGNPKSNRDVVGFEADSFCAVVAIIIVRQGRIISKLIHRLKPEDFEDKGQGLFDFLQQYFALRSDFPDELLLPFDVADGQLLCEYLSELAGKKVAVKVPQRGELVRLVAIANKNAFDALRLMMNKEEKAQKSIRDLQKTLGLKQPPLRIEAIDISNTGGDENVGAIITYVNGEKEKSGYKKFKINSFVGQDDYASMREVIARRFTDYLDKKAGFDILPDLLLVDGGKGQVEAVAGVIDSLNISVPVYGMIKDNKHKTRGIVSREGEIELKMTSPAFVLVASIQEEVHRFAIGFHRQRRSSTLTKSKLDYLPGIGKNRKEALLKKFKTVSAIEKATPEEIAEIQGFSIKMAQDILLYLKSH